MDLRTSRSPAPIGRLHGFCEIRVRLSLPPGWNAARGSRSTLPVMLRSAEYEHQGPALARTIQTQLEKSCIG